MPVGLVMHLNKSRVEQRPCLASERKLEMEICGKDVPERKRKREVCKKTSVGVCSVVNTALDSF